MWGIQGGNLCTGGMLWVLVRGSLSPWAFLALRGRWKEDPQSFHCREFHCFRSADTHPMTGLANMRNEGVKLREFLIREPDLHRNFAAIPPLGHWLVHTRSFARD